MQKKIEAAPPATSHALVPPSGASDMICSFPCSTSAVNGCRTGFTMLREGSRTPSSFDILICRELLSFLEDKVEFRPVN